MGLQSRAVPCSPRGESQKGRGGGGTCAPYRAILLGPSYWALLTESSAPAPWGGVLVLLTGPSYWALLTECTPAPWCCRSWTSCCAPALTWTSAASMGRWGGESTQPLHFFHSLLLVVGLWPTTPESLRPATRFALSFSSPSHRHSLFSGSVLGAGCWVLGAGCWVLGAGCWVLGAGCWVLGAGCWVLGAGWVPDSADDRVPLRPPGGRANATPPQRRREYCPKSPQSQQAPGTPLSRPTPPTSVLLPQCPPLLGVPCVCPRST